MFVEIYTDYRFRGLFFLIIFGILIYISEFVIHNTPLPAKEQPALFIHSVICGLFNYAVDSPDYAG
jgi:hypothetical protein